MMQLRHVISRHSDVTIFWPPLAYSSLPSPPAVFLPIENKGLDRDPADSIRYCRSSATSCARSQLGDSDPLVAVSILS